MEKRDLLVEHLKSFFMENINKGYGIEMVFLYGSWARGFPRLDSDIDIAIVFSEEPSSEEESFKIITDISLSLAAELGGEINAIQIHKDFRKPMLYYNAIALGLPVYVKKAHKYIILKNDAIYQMEDYSIFGIDWQYEVARNNLEALRHA